MGGEVRGWVILKNINTLHILEMHIGKKKNPAFSLLKYFPCFKKQNIFVSIRFLLLFVLERTYGKIFATPMESFF